VDRPDEAKIEALLDAAREAREHAYAPYSQYLVGAAVLTDDGEIFAGANVENAAYPLSVCAERSAVQRAASEGARRLVAVAIVGSSPDGPAWPCGGCRQVLNEFSQDLLVISEGPGGLRDERELAELLPDAFGPDDLR
jgi:cytidine deaminase